MLNQSKSTITPMRAFRNELALVEQWETQRRAEISRLLTETFNGKGSSIMPSLKRTLSDVLIQTTSDVCYRWFRNLLDHTVVTCLDRFAPKERAANHWPKSLLLTDDSMHTCVLEHLCDWRTYGTKISNQERLFERCAHALDSFEVLDGGARYMWWTLTGMELSVEVSDAERLFHWRLAGCMSTLLESYERDVRVPLMCTRVMEFLPCREIATLACSYALDPAVNARRRAVARQIVQDARGDVDQTRQRLVVMELVGVPDPTGAQHLLDPLYDPDEDSVPEDRRRLGRGEAAWSLPALGRIWTGWPHRRPRAQRSVDRRPVLPQAAPALGDPDDAEPAVDLAMERIDDWLRPLLDLWDAAQIGTAQISTATPTDLAPADLESVLERRTEALDMLRDWAPFSCERLRLRALAAALPCGWDAVVARRYRPRYPVLKSRRLRDTLRHLFRHGSLEPAAMVVFDLDDTLVHDFGDFTCACEEAERVLKYLQSRGHLMAIASHNERAWRHVHTLGWQKYFACVAGRDPKEIGRGKMALFLEIVENSRVAIPLTQWHFFDDLKANVDEARRHGIRAHLVNWRTGVTMADVIAAGL